MAFIDIAELDSHYEAVKFYVCGYEAVDSDNKLALYTTNGRSKTGGKRRWFVVRYILPSGKADNTAGHIQFRAADLDAALDWLKQPRNQTLIQAKFS